MQSDTPDFFLSCLHALGDASETVPVCKLNLVQKTFPREKEILVSSKSHYFDKTDLSPDTTT